MRKNTPAALLVIILFISCGYALSFPSDSGLRFSVGFSPEARGQALTGRVYVMLTRNSGREPRFQVRRASGIPFWGKNVSALKPGETAVIDDEAFGFPVRSLGDIPAGEYYVQGFINVYTRFDRADGHTVWLHKDQWEGQNWLRSPGNMYSDVKKVTFDPAQPQTIALICEHVIPPIEMPPDSKWVKRIKFRSRLLSDFWGQPMYLGATILLPQGYDQEPDRFYPVNYIQGHFSLRAPYGFRDPEAAESGRTGRGGSAFTEFWKSEACPRMLAVTFQHPCPYYDDSHGMNSPNLGPYGDAVMQELIPAIEERFRIIREPYARVLSGGSTGGWISLAMQIFYPDFFGGTFSSCPDSVDFRAHQLVNIYSDKNAYYTEYEWLRVERPTRRGPDGQIREMMKDENHYELAVGDRCRSGGQWEIYMACYGPVGADGYPRPLWDKLTGEIDPEVARYWQEHFNLRAYLEKNWAEIGPKLAGKLHIYVGDMDSYYLNNAVRHMQDFLEKTQNPAYGGVVEYGDGASHGWGPRGPALLGLMGEHIRKMQAEAGK